MQECSIKQSLLGRVLGFGRVEVEAADAQRAEVLERVPKPGFFRDQVYVLSEKRRGDSPAVQAVSGGI